MELTLPAGPDVDQGAAKEVREGAAKRRDRSWASRL